MRLRATRTDAYVAILVVIGGSDGEPTATTSGWRMGRPVTPCGIVAVCGTQAARCGGLIGAAEPMNDRPTAKSVANELARERNREAAERTLMAWIRTALSLIGFGFGIGKLDAYLKGAGLRTRFDVPHSSLIFGASFIIVGILGLLAAIVQHARVLRRLSRADFAYDAMRPIAMTVATLLMLIGLFGLIAILW
jgi:putative membrane protein